jgi:hypothetical protein
VCNSHIVKIKNQLKMKIKLIRSYRKSTTGNTVFVYAVSGTPAQIEAFKTAQGDNLVIDTESGAPLWFTTRCIGQAGTLVITSKGKVVPDMSAFEQAASLAKQYGGNFGQELARASVAQLLGHNGASTPAESVASAAGIDKM